MNWTRAIEGYGRHLGSERGMSPHTQRAYLADVRQLTLHTGADTLPESVDADHVRSWLASLNKRRSAATRGRKLASIRSFFRWLVREGIRREDPTAGLPMPKLEKRLPRPLSIDDCAQLVTAQRPMSRRPTPEGGSRARSDHWLALRDRAIAERVEVEANRGDFDDLVGVRIESGRLEIERNIRHGEGRSSS